MPALVVKGTTASLRKRESTGGVTMAMRTDSKAVVGMVAVVGGGFGAFESFAMETGCLRRRVEEACEDHMLRLHCLAELLPGRGEHPAVVVVVAGPVWTILRAIRCRAERGVTGV